VPEQGKKGCLVPFGMRLLRPEIWYAAGRPQEALEALYGLLTDSQGDGGAQDDETQSEAAHHPGGGGGGARDLGLPAGGGRRRAVKSALVNLHLERRDYYPTLQLLGELRDEYPDEECYGWIMCRVHLTFGGIKAAQDVASEV
jgi:hypothetical protein